MKSSELLTYFPLSTRLVEKTLIDSNQNVISEYSFEEAKTFHYRLFKSLPSTLYFDLNIKDMDNVLKFLKDEGFMFLLSHNLNSNNDETVTTFLIHEEREVLIKTYWLNTDIDTYRHIKPDSFVEGDEEYMDFEEFMNGGRAPTGEWDIMFTFVPTASNVAFFEKFKSILTVEKPENSPDYVHIFEKTAEGKLKLSPYKVDSFNIDIEKHYNPDFSKINENIIEWCGNFKQKNNRLVLFHGPPGNGKTNYIKYLMTKNKKVRKIYIPPYYVSAMTDPGFFNFIKNYANSILIIEDAEKILLSRETDAENSAMSVILNLTDGILGDVLNFKIIGTFNVDEKKIDPALKRKGRLHLKYNFNFLSEDRTRNLYKELYGKEPPERNMCLADIFNAEDNGEVKKVERSIGFGQ